MKNLLITLVALFGFITSANAELPQSELNKLTSQQRQIYEKQLKEYNAEIKKAQTDLYKAEDIIKMGNEMKGDNAKSAGTAHVMRGMELKEKAEKAIKEAQKKIKLLDDAAREAIKNNEKNKK